MKLLKTAIGLTAAAGLTEYAIAEYFFRRTMIRTNAKKERTMKMAGTDWDRYIPEIKKRREALEARPHDDISITSFDGLKLKGTYFPYEGSRKTVLFFHGYTGEGISNFAGVSDYYIRQGYNMLVVDARAHGQSEGTYIGFGCLDRRDALRWIDYIIKREGEDIEIVLHGTSMGGATALMTSGLHLPEQVKKIVADCAFTSAWDVFSHVLSAQYHMPPFPLMNLADEMVKKRAGYGLAECNSANEVKKAKIPILFIHGDADTFVPCSMCYENYENCASPREMLIIEGAAHAEAYFKDTEKYEAALTQLLNR